MSVVTCPIFAGQFVTVAAQDVTVYTVVVLTVDVVYDTLDGVVTANPLSLDVVEEDGLTELELEM